MYRGSYYLIEINQRDWAPVLHSIFEGDINQTFNLLSHKIGLLLLGRLASHLNWDEKIPLLFCTALYLLLLLLGDLLLYFDQFRNVHLTQILPAQRAILVLLKPMFDTYMVKNVSIILIMLKLARCSSEFLLLLKLIQTHCTHPILPIVYRH